MCGIVGLLAKTPAIAGDLGKLVVPMLDCMGDRGPDSAGLAVFSPLLTRGLKVNLFVRRESYDWASLRTALLEDGLSFDQWNATARHVEALGDFDPETLRDWLARARPEVHVLSVGRSIDMYKDEGHPRDIAATYGFAKMSGSHAVGHTRMATESAVSPAHAHPFTAGQDFCLVHNGSLSNPYDIRRKLERRGVKFETDNDTEAACRFLEWRMREGDSLEQAIEKGFDELDGFYTLLMGTQDRLVLVRDPFACKPAVVAETDQYVAVASEFRALAHLPGVASAKLFEPVPQRIYSWPVPSFIQTRAA
jgi:glutamate synthase domain-containing protein 1